MGVCYTLILFDEFDWEYVGTDKKTRMQELKDELADKANVYCFEQLGEWYNYFVVDLDKRNPYMPERAKIIYKYCDKAWYYDDISPWDIREIVNPEETVFAPSPT